MHKLGLSLLMLTAWQAQAAWECNIPSKDDIIIDAKQVQIVGASGNLSLAQDGQVIRDGKAVEISMDIRKLAQNLQQDIRRDVPWIDDGVKSHIETARKSLDKVIVEQVGEDSNMRKRLSTLDSKLKEQINLVLEKRKDGYWYHHKMIAQVEQNGQQLMNQTMGGLLQDSINEMGVKQATVAMKSNNPLQAIVGSLGGLEKAVRKEWKHQNAEFQQFGNEACDRLMKLDSQRQELLNTLPKQ